MTASNLIHNHRKPTPVLRYIHPPASAAHDPHQFAEWLKEVGIRLLRAGFGDVQLIPMVKAEDESLFLGMEVDDATAHAIRAAVHH
jgi:hypothetical protein